MQESLGMLKIKRMMVTTKEFESIEREETDMFLTKLINFKLQRKGI